MNDSEIWARIEQNWKRSFLPQTETSKLPSSSPNISFFGICVGIMGVTFHAKRITLQKDDDKQVEVMSWVYLYLFTVCLVGSMIHFVQNVKTQRHYSYSVSQILAYLTLMGVCVVSGYFWSKGTYTT